MSEHNERKIVAQIVDSALEAGYVVSINDGGAWPVKRSSNREEILKAIRSSDEDILHFYKGAERLGWVHLIYGNDTDVIHNNSDNSVINELLKPAEHLASQL